MAFNSLSLCGIPQTGSLMLAGMSLFSGCSYYSAITGKDTLRKVTPYGVLIMMVAWLTFAL